MFNFESNQINLRKVAWVLMIVFRYMAFVGTIYFLIGLSSSIERNYPLWVNPQYAEGIITDYKDISWESKRINGTGTHTVTAHLPVVEFKTATDRTIIFTDNKGNQSKSNKVSVIYAQDDPNNAKIDKGQLWNWIDVYIFFFGTIGCLLTIVRFSKANTDTILKKLGDKNA